ncbi:MAG: gluconokinase, GntK/IdnK-type [Pseudomonadota bacterium]
MAAGDTHKPPLLVIMGIAGCGKTTFGQHLAARLGWRFFEGDEFHASANIEKMRAGVPLTDDDRRGWIVSIVEAVDQHGEAPAVLACSALSSTVRRWLGAVRFHQCHWVWLDIGEADACRRIEGRDGHFMPPGLVASQLAALAPPSDAVRLDATQECAVNASKLLKSLADHGVVTGDVTAGGLS